MANAKKISTDAAIVALLSELDYIFILKELDTQDFSAAWLN